MSEESGVEWYHEFIDKDYSPSKNDVIALYYYEPAEGVSNEDIVGRLASESSVGTWTTLETLDKRIYGIRGRSFWYDEHFVKIAYPDVLWEPSNIPQLLSGIAGNIFGMKAVRNLQLCDALLPQAFIKKNLGPNLGTTTISEILKKNEGPVLCTVPKPKIGMTVDQHVKVAEDGWRGGLDIIKDDENLTDQDFNRFQLRVQKMAKTRGKIEAEVGGVKEAFINVTAETHEMERRIKLIHDNGFRYFMMDVVTCGFSAVQSARIL
ncbi:MAG TPA: RuBisCO large subunit C-terminal-like domain-containing protein, partial [Candidatus Hodarchaeales archaeon]|nr:RuBisCO large subunit C-terminal-like domain-containing protein [Candidatus Hodarchaeales archaeon]